MDKTKIICKTLLPKMLYLMWLGYDVQFHQGAGGDIYIDHINDAHFMISRDEQTQAKIGIQRLYWEESGIGTKPNYFFSEAILDKMRKH